MKGHSHELSIYHSNAFKLRPVVMNYPKVHWIFLWSPTDANMANVFLQRSRNYINDLSCIDYVTPNYVIKNHKWHHFVFFISRLMCTFAI